MSIFRTFTLCSLFCGSLNSLFFTACLSTTFLCSILLSLYLLFRYSFYSLFFFLTSFMWLCISFSCTLCVHFTFFFYWFFLFDLPHPLYSSPYPSLSDFLVLFHVNFVISLFYFVLNRLSFTCSFFSFCYPIYSSRSHFPLSFFTFFFLFFFFYRSFCSRSSTPSLSLSLFAFNPLLFTSSFSTICYSLCPPLSFFLFYFLFSHSLLPSSPPP